MGHWSIYTQQKAKGAYHQLARRHNGRREVFTLGYLSDAQLARLASTLEARAVALARNTKEETQYTVRRLLASADADAARNADQPTGSTPTLTLAAAEEMRRLAAASPTAGPPTLEEFVRGEWWPQRLVDAQDRTTRERTLRKAAPLWRVIFSRFGSWQLKSLTAAEWLKFLNGRSDTWSPPTKHKAQHLLRRALEHAVILGHIKEVPTFRPIQGSSSTRRPRITLTAPEVTRLIEHAAGAMHACLFAVAFGQGLRPAEAPRIRWEDIDLEGHRLLIRGTKTAKSKAWIPLLPGPERALLKFREQLGGKPKGHIFTWDGKPITNRWSGALSESAKRAELFEPAQRAGIDTSDGNTHITPYSARYTFATLAGSTMPPMLARAVLRHSQSSRTLEAVYEQISVEQAASQLRGTDLFMLPGEAPATPTKAPSPATPQADLHALIAAAGGVDALRAVLAGLAEEA